MQRTKNGFLSGYNTKARKIYSDNHIKKMCELREKGLSLRAIAREMDMPFGSVHRIIKDNIKIEYKIIDNNTYINRTEAKEIFEITDSQFDYVKNKYPKLYKKINNMVYIDKRYFTHVKPANYGYKSRYNKE